MGKINFFQKIWKKIKPSKIQKPITQLPIATWDGISMSSQQEYKVLTIDQKKWLRIYIKTGKSRRSHKLHELAESKISSLFTSEQLDELKIAFNMRKDVGGVDMWNETIYTFLKENGIVY